jgi:hypothetical protein
LELDVPAKAFPGTAVAISDLDPEVAQIFLAHNRDVTTMTVDELDALEAELLRFTE